MKLFSSVSVKWKIYSIVLVSLVGFAGYLAFNVQVNTNNARLLEEVRDLHFPILESAKANRERLDRINELFNTAVTIAEMDFVDNADNLSNDLYASMDQAIKLNPDDAVALATIKANFASYLNQAKDIAVGMIDGSVDFDQLADLAANKENALAETILSLDQYISFAQDRFNRSIREANQNSETLLNSGFVIWAANVVILAVTAIAIARLILTNIVSVSTSLEEIASGEGDLDQEIAVTSSDEIGQLAISFNHLMERLREKTNDLMSMMQNMHQGLFTVMQKNDELVIHPEYAAYVEQIFETENIAGMAYEKLLFSRAELGSDERDQILTAINSIIKEDAMMFEFNSHLLPNEIVCRFPDRRKAPREDGSPDDSRIKILEIDWDPIIANDIVDKMMVTVRDVTALRAAAREAEAQKEELEIIGQILSISPAKFDAFLSSAQEMLAKNLALIQSNTRKDLQVVADLFVNMHTIKGNTRTYGFKFITDLVHDAETTYDRLRKEEDLPWDVEQLLEELESVQVAIERYARIKEEKLNFDFSLASNTNLVSISREQYQQLIGDLKQLTQQSGTEAIKDSLSRIRKDLMILDTRPLSEMISGILDSLPSIAQQLDKAPPLVEIHDGIAGIKSEHGEMISNVFTHLLRNSIDHGIETREERKAHGKHAQGKIEIDLSIKEDKALLTLKDDGRGLALARIRAKAQENNTPLSENPSAQEVADLLFTSGVSTADSISDISGRGVGMDAVKKFLQAQQADIQVVLQGSPSANDEFVPFELHVTLPAHMIEKTA